MKSKLDPRHSARKLALSAVFCWLFSESDDEQSLILSQELLNQDDIAKDLTLQLVGGVKAHKEEIDRIISESAPDWPLDKISKIDLVILRIAIFEILFSDQTPDKVAIDESIELAKDFGNDTSAKFINGVLGTVVKNYKDNKKDDN